MEKQTIGQRIEMRRRELGLTLDDIANEIGVARSTIQRYEKDSIEKVKLPVIEAIARVLCVNPAWLCCKSDDMMCDKKEPVPASKDGPSEKERLVYERLSKLTPDNLDIALAQLDVLLRHQEKRDTD